MKTNRLRELSTVLALAAMTMSACDNNSSSIQDDDFAQTNQAIIDGTPVTDDSEQSTVALIISAKTDNGGILGLQCTGTLIAPDWVLTAGHCVRLCIGRDGELTGPVDLPARIEEGSYYASVLNDWFDRDPEKNTFRIVKGIAYKDYICDLRTKFEHDIGLLQLEKPVPPELAKPMPLLPRKEGYKLSQKEVNEAYNWDTHTSTLPFESIGFGNSYYPNTSYLVQGIKYKMVTPVYAYCSKDSDKNDYCQRDSAMFVYTGTSTNLCQGDSGGPTYLTRNGKRFIVGVTSATNDHTPDNKPTSSCNGISALTLVDDYLDFIYENIPELVKSDKEDCSNGIDDDGDMLADCEDPTCAEDAHCKGGDNPVDPQPADKEICDNTIDDDGNGLADCKDPACAEDEHCKNNGDGGDDPVDPGQNTDPDPGNTDKPENPGNTDKPENPGNTDKPENPGNTDKPENPGNTDKPADSEQNTDPEDDIKADADSCSATPQSPARGSLAWALLLLCGGLAAMRRRVKATK